MRQILIRVLIGVLAVAIVATGGYFAVRTFLKPSEADPNDPSGGGEVLTNRYNEAIIDKKLTTSDYSGTYKYKDIVCVTFNEYDEETNPDGLTEVDIQTLLENRGITGGIPTFNSYLGALKKEKVYGKYNGETLVTPGTNEAFTFVIPVGDNGQPSSYGLFTQSEAGNKLYNAKVYGDKNLALVDFDKNAGKNKFMISLNYTTVEDAIALKNPVDKSQEEETVIYVFEDVYSTAIPTLRLFTITYQYVLQEEDPSYPSGDLEFEI